MAMKEYELAAVSEAGHEGEFFGSSPDTDGSVAIDAGQRSLLAGELKVDEEKAVGKNEEGEEERQVWCGLLSIRFYQQFFDVDTKDVTDRWMESITSFKGEARFFEIVGDKPDAYGPFWNATSLIFLIALSTNINHGGHDLSKLVMSTWIVYGFAVVSPAAIWLGLNQLGIPVTVIQAGCAYGYALAPFLVATIICALPVPYLSMLALGAAGGISTIFLLRTFTPVVVEKIPSLSVPVMVALGAGWCLPSYVVTVIPGRCSLAFYHWLVCGTAVQAGLLSHRGLQAVFTLVLLLCFFT